MNDAGNIIFFLQTLNYREDLEMKLFSNLELLTNSFLAVDKVSNLYNQKVHPTLIKNTMVVLQNSGVLYKEKDKFLIIRDKLHSFIKMVSIAKAVRDYKWPITTLKPYLYVSPPNIISSDLVSEVDDISNLLTNLVSSATESIIIMSPFTNKAGLSSILTPLKVCKKPPLISVYLTAPSRNQSIIVNQINGLLPSNITKKINMYFCNSDSTEEDHLPHAKLLIVDEKRGYLGSANFTRQGLSSRFEVGIELNEQQSKSVIKLFKMLLNKNIFSEYNS